MEFGAGPLQTSLAVDRDDDAYRRIQAAAHQRVWLQTSSEHPLLRIVRLNRNLLLRTPNVFGHASSQGDGRRLAEFQAWLRCSFRKEIVFIPVKLTQKSV